jgi:hydrophobic/amphiphilic exporter-1 (mainly G- bacteria), HAE1 family
VITEIETDTSRAFSIYLYADDPGISRAALFDRAINLQKAVEKVPGINKINLSAQWEGSAIDANGGNDSTYEVHIIIPPEKLAALSLTLAQISQIISGYNRDQPIGNFAIGEKKYDFRIEGKTRESLWFLALPIPLTKWGTVTLGEIATIERKYKNDAKNLIVMWGSDAEKCKKKSPAVSGESEKKCQNIALPYVGMTVNKNDGADIFKSSDAAKKVVEEYMKRDEYKGFHTVYAIDLADTIRDDYAELAKEAVTTLILVFIAMYLFVWFRDSLFASVTLPLAFLSTFILLYSLGYTMNFLTNFSLILSFGIAVDTIIVIVQWASAKIRVGYNPRSAIMLALREYAVPIISWVMTTIVVFIPMMTLPGILGKFLAYIPITIFWVLATGLVLALTVNSALYLLFVRKWKSYVDDPHAIEYATDEEKELLTLEREGKERIWDGHVPLRIRTIHSVTEWYKKVLRNFLEHTFLRRLSIFVPVVLLVLSFILLAPRVGFELFPVDDNAYTSFDITGPVWQKTEVTARDLESIGEIFVWYPEIKYTNISINGDSATAAVQLTKRDVRKKNDERSVFVMEKVLLDKLQIFESKGYKVVSRVLENGPPGSKAVWLKLIVDEGSKLPLLIKVSKEFEAHLKTIKGTKNVWRSSWDTPGQFIFKLKKDLLSTTGISAAMIYAEMAQNMNGVTIGSIEDNGEDMNIILKTTQFRDAVRLEDILSIPISVWPTAYRIGDFIESHLTNATASISRENGNIQIAVDADLEVGIDSVSTQAEFVKYASSYDFPSWVSYKAWWENQENGALITAILSAFFIALIVIFSILTLQFHSFSQPLVILYSVIMSLPFVMLGLLATGNQFSMPFGIGFIAFTGIAVNHGIILISAINENLKKWIEGITALVEAGSSRLEPMLLTTVTTALGILPIALRDKFWAGMGFTIIFGVISASLLTLFIVKGIYYELYMNGEDGMMKGWWKKIKGFLSRIWMWIRSRSSKKRAIK